MSCPDLTILQGTRFVASRNGPLVTCRFSCKIPILTIDIPYVAFEVQGMGCHLWTRHWAWWTLVEQLSRHLLILAKSLWLIWRMGTRRWNLRVPNLQMSRCDLISKIGHQVSSLCNGHQDDMPLLKILPLLYFSHCGAVCNNYHVT